MKPKQKTDRERALQLVRDVLGDKRSQSMRRSMTVETVETDDDKRTVELSFASEAPVETWFGEETLEISEQAVDLERLNSGGSGLVNHDANDQVAVVERAWIDPSTSRARAVLRFSRSARGQEIYDDIKDGIRRLVSVGYTIRTMVSTGIREGLETFRVTRWIPHEVSIVSIPADASIGVGRSMQEGQRIQSPTTKNMETPITTPEPTAPVIDFTAEREKIRKDEGSRIREITAIGNHYKVPAERIQKAIAGDESLESFRGWMLTDHLKAAPAKPYEPIMGERDVKRYSLTKLLSDMARGKVDGLEREMSDELAKRTKRDTAGALVPQEILGGRKRALMATNATAGGYTVQTDVLGGELIEALRNKTLSSMLGIRRLGDLVGNVAIPRVAGGATAYWLDETSAVAESEMVFGQLAGKPKRLSARTAYNRQLLAQSSLDVEAEVRMDVFAVTELALDLAIFHGTGGVQPLGIINTPGIDRSLTFGGAATRADTIALQRAVADRNAHRGALAYVSTPATAAAWMNIEEAAGTAQWLWKGNIDEGMVVGRNAFSTNQIADDLVFYGDFTQGVIFDWAGYEVIVNPYTQDASNNILVTVHKMVDFGVRHPAAFTVSMDSGAQ